MKFLLIVLKNVRRNLVRTTLTALGTMVLVFVVTLIWSVLSFLDKVTTEQASDVKAIVTERWQIPSQMPFAYAASLEHGAARNPGDIEPTETMTWQFYGGSTDKENKTFENLLFFFALEPIKLSTMMDDLDPQTLGPEKNRELMQAIHKLEANKRGAIIGRERLERMNKRVGDRITVYSMNFKEIDLEFEIVGVFPDGRYNQNAAMNRDYLNDALDAYQRSHNGKKHAMADRSLNLFWLKVPDQAAYTKIAGQILASPEYSSPAVKCETAASGIGAFLESYRDLIWGVRWMLAPAILVTLSLVIANAISISVRERRLEIAVLKVLGFRPRHILTLILGEALLIGTLAGSISAGTTYLVINHVFHGIKFPIAFFPAFLIPGQAFAWGFGIGIVTAFVGSIIPAWSARSVKVADVFSKVA